MSRECFSALRNKDVINLCDGKRLGFVNDMEIDTCSGKICALVVIFDCRVLGFGKCEELVIPWEKVSCFGKDTVLVNIGTEIYAKLGCSDKKHDEKNKKY